jgi:formamidopyrimidine-DNA glycosylase
MPELPEVQTIVNDLQSIVGMKITGFWSDFGKAVKTKNFAKKITGQKIKKIFRSGKNIIIALNTADSIIIHLKMTGQLLTEKHISKADHEKYSKHIHHVFYLGKNYSLNFSDIRKFGTLEVVDAKSLLKKISAKGLDPFSAEYTFRNFQKLLQRAKNKNIKQFLMDQSFVSGIGNIYASEIPFDTKLSPLKKVSLLSSAETKKLFISIKKILSKAIKLRGTSFSDYRDGSGKKGAFQNFLKVYKRNGQKCKRCATIIEKITIGQRSTFYCPVCQK